MLCQNQLNKGSETANKMNTTAIIAITIPIPLVVLKLGETSKDIVITS